MSPEAKEQIALIESRPNNLAYGPEDRAYLLALVQEQSAKLDSLSNWAGRSRTGYYDEAQDDVVAIIHGKEGKA